GWRPSACTSSAGRLVSRRSIATGVSPVPSSSNSSPHCGHSVASRGTIALHVGHSATMSWDWTIEDNPLLRFEGIVVSSPLSDLIGPCRQAGLRRPRWVSARGRRDSDGRFGFRESRDVDLAVQVETFCKHRLYGIVWAGTIYYLVCYHH